MEVWVQSSNNSEENQTVSKISLNTFISYSLSCLILFSPFPCTVFQNTHPWVCMKYLNLGINVKVLFGTSTPLINIKHIYLYNIYTSLEMLPFFRFFFFSFFSFFFRERVRRGIGRGRERIVSRLHAQHGAQGRIWSHNLTSWTEIIWTTQVALAWRYFLMRSLIMKFL